MVGRAGLGTLQEQMWTSLHLQLQRLPRSQSTQASVMERPMLELFAVTKCMCNLGMYLPPPPPG